VVIEATDNPQPEIRQTTTTTGRHWIGREKGGGGILNATENDFGPILYFLEIANVGEAYLIFENN